jgi:hypothetical protein
MRDELIERLAAIDHERWRKHQQRIQDVSFRVVEPIILPGDYRQTEPGALVIDAARAEYWHGMADTAYADLPEPYKEEIRGRVIESWHLMVEFVANWLEDHGTLDWGFPGGSELADLWRNEMVTDELEAQ